MPTIIDLIILKHPHQLFSADLGWSSQSVASINSILLRQCDGQFGVSAETWLDSDTLMIRNLEQIPSGSMGTIIMTNKPNKDFATANSARKSEMNPAM